MEIQKEETKQFIINLVDGNHILIIGPRSSGKTNLIKSLCYDNSKLNAIVSSGTNTKKEYDYIPSIYHHGCLPVDAVTDWSKIKDQKESLLTILEEPSAQPNRENERSKDLAFILEAKKTLVLYSIQYLIQLPENCVKAFKIICVSSPLFNNGMALEDAKSFIKHFNLNKLFSTSKQLINQYNQLDKYTFLVIDLNQQKIYSYKAPDMSKTNFQMGNKDYKLIKVQENKLEKLSRI